jgi:hypothetical protein
MADSLYTFIFACKFEPVRKTKAPERAQFAPSGARCENNRCPYWSVTST